ncbi:MAG: tetratricopeptide repeat protein [Methanothrix sp.]|jgi:tetratricopeptide (TPR) repeat protein|nr:tetratricopeptide repeat protein [Methanothrix sp.]
MNAKFAIALIALATLCTCAAAQGDTAEDWHQQGQELMENGSYEEALRAYDSAIELDPEDAGIWMGKGDTQSRMGDYNESQKTYENALDLINESLEANPLDARGWFVKGELLDRLYRYDEALESYNRSLEIDPTDKEAWFEKGNTLDTAAAFQTQDPERIRAYEDAIIAYDEALKLDPDYGNAWMRKGYSLHSLAAFNKNLSMYDESLKAFDRAIELIPDNDTRNLAFAWEGRAIALTGIGNILEDAGRQDEARASWEEALEAYERAIELDPSYTGLEARLYKAGILAELGRYNESIDSFDELIETLPASYALYAATVLTEKGNVLQMMGDYEGAIIAFDGALELDPSSMIAMQGKGTALQSLGRISEADAAFAEAEELGYEG